MLDQLVLGFQVATEPLHLALLALGALVGTLVGILPGLGPTATIALILPISYGLDASSLIIFMAAVYYGAMYGGSTTSILLNIPGESASVVTGIDGNPMAKQGRAGQFPRMSRSAFWMKRGKRCDDQQGSKKAPLGVFRACPLLWGDNFLLVVQCLSIFTV